jgi:antitoxin ParD1/3/4
MAMPTSVALSSHFETFVRDQVESGRYNNASEVVRAGLRLLEDQQKQAELQLEAMKAAIAAGLASGRSIPGDQVFDRLEAKYRKQAASAGR